jgi:hypothetical protein
LAAGYRPMSSVPISKRNIAVASHAAPVGSTISISCENSLRQTASTIPGSGTGKKGAASLRSQNS